MDAYLLDWLSLLLRWLHLIAGVAWIGASFYFVWLDNHLVPSADPRARERGVSGELWSVHGGGFYHNQKLPLGPRGEPLTEDLHWFKWEAYTTWMSGMGLVVTIYWWNASTWLVDPAVAALSPAAAVAASAAIIVAGWVVYDLLCRLLERHGVVLGCVLAIEVALTAWLSSTLFAARAAYLEVGFVMGTIMAANVLMVIIPGQRALVEALRAGRAPDPVHGLRGKQRSVHNTYFTLPVLFVMISTHYPMTYGHRHAWVVLLAIAAAGALVRQFFVLRHKGVVRHDFAIAGVVLIAAVIVALAPVGRTAPAPHTAVNFDRVRDIISHRCLACHAVNPSQPGFAQPPKGIVLETPRDIGAHAQKIHETVAITRYMPLGNLTGITDDERAEIAAWYDQGASLR